MIDAIDEQLVAIRKTAVSQQNRVASELNSGGSAFNVAAVEFSTTMKQVAELREQADKLQSAAILAFDTACTNIQAVSQNIINQLANGKMVMGSDQPLPPKRKMNLVAGAGE